MTDVSLDSLGPIDYLVVEFPAGSTNFTGEMAEELLRLVDAGTIRVIDILILVKGEDGVVDAMELSDLDDLGELQVLEAELAELRARPAERELPGRGRRPCTLDRHLLAPRASPSADPGCDGPRSSGPAVNRR